MRIAFLPLLLCPVVGCVVPEDVGESEQPIIGGTTVTGPTLAISINGGFCSGVLVAPNRVLTAAHCLTSPMTITHVLPSGTTETANVVMQMPHPLYAGKGTYEEPYDEALLWISPSLTMPAGSLPAAFDDGRGRISGSVECYGAGASSASGGGAGTMRKITLPIKGVVAGGHVLELVASASATLAPGDSGGPCWNTVTKRIVGTVQGQDAVSPTVNSLAIPDQDWLADKLYGVPMFGLAAPAVSSSGATRWRTAHLKSSKTADIVALNSASIEVFSGTPTAGVLSLGLGTTLAVAGSSPDSDLTTFGDVDHVATGSPSDLLDDLIVPSTTGIDVTPSTGPLAFGTKATTTFGTPAPDPNSFVFSNVDESGGVDLYYADTTAITLAPSSGTTFTLPGFRTPWVPIVGNAAPARLDATAGQDLGLVSGNSIYVYPFLKSTPIPSTIPGSKGTWENYSGFDDVNGHNVADWVAIRDQDLPTIRNDGAGSFPSSNFATTPIEIGAGWDAVSSGAWDIDGDGSVDWVGLDANYIYVKPGLGNGTYGCVKTQRHVYGATTNFTMRDVDGDGLRDLILFNAPSPGMAVVLPFSKTAWPIVKDPLCGVAQFSWSDLLKSMTRATSLVRTPIEALCLAGGCGPATSSIGKRKISGGGLLAGLQPGANGTNVIALSDSLARGHKWRWTTNDMPRAAFDLDGDGTDELAFAGTDALVIARITDGLELVASRAYGTQVGPVTLTAQTGVSSFGNQLLLQGAEGAVLATLDDRGFVPTWAYQGTTTDRRDAASVAMQQQRAYAALRVVPGTHVIASMTGTGDADLYVRFGAAPTLSAFDCRPYTGSANETCDLVVPANVTTAYVMVAGYTAASYSLDVSYTPAEGLVATLGDTLVVASPGTWTVYAPSGNFTAPAVLGDQIVGIDRGVLVARIDGLYRLSGQGAQRVMPWSGGVVAGTSMQALGDVDNDGYPELAAIVQGSTLEVVTATPNGALVRSARAVASGSTVVAAAGGSVAIASPQAFELDTLGGFQLVQRTRVTLGPAQDGVSTVSALPLLPRMPGGRMAVVSLTSQ